MIMNTDNPLEEQNQMSPPGIVHPGSQNLALDSTTFYEEKLREQSVVPEHLSPAVLAACHCAKDPSLLDQELEFLWEDSGAPGKFYEVYLGKISRNPIVKSKISGKYFVLPWSVIIKLAVEKGIDK